MCVWIRTLRLRYVRVVSALDFSASDKALIAPKVRDMTRYFSPKAGEKMAYRYILYLLFEQYDIWCFGRSPVNEARAGMWLYLFDIQRIERSARSGQYSANTDIASLYEEFKQLQDRGVLDWPSSFQTACYVQPRYRHHGFP